MSSSMEPISKENFNWKKFDGSDPPELDLTYLDLSGTRLDRAFVNTQKSVLSAAHGKIAAAMSAIEHFYFSDDDFAGLNRYDAVLKQSGVYSRDVYEAGMQTLRCECPCWYERILKAESRAENTVNGVWLLEHLYDLLCEELELDHAISNAWLGFEKFCDTSNPLYASFDRIDSYIRRKTLELTRERWRGITVHELQCLGQCTTIHCHDDEFMFHFKLVPDDNYYHWSNYMYEFIKKDDKDAIIPDGFEHDYSDYRWVSGIVERLPPICIS